MPNEPAYSTTDTAGGMLTNLTVEQPKVRISNNI